MSYLFVDGAYLRAIVAKWCEHWYGEPGGFNPDAIGPEHHKVFYYDAGPPVETATTAGVLALPPSDSEELFERLRARDGWHVSLGDSKRRGKGQQRHVQQKEVDVLLAVDMLTHAHRRNATSLALLAGDLDFRPLLEAVVREGAYVTLICEEASASMELRHAADAVRFLDFNALANFVDPKFFTSHAKISVQFQSSGVDTSLYEPVRHYYLADQRVATLYRSPSPEMMASLVLSNGPLRPHGQWALVLGNDEALLCKVFAHHVPVGDWRSV